MLANSPVESRSAAETPRETSAPSIASARLRQGVSTASWDDAGQVCQSPQEALKHPEGGRKRGERENQEADRAVGPCPAPEGRVSTNIPLHDETQGSHRASGTWRQRPQMARPRPCRPRGLPGSGCAARSEAATETLDPTTRVDHLLLARVERMASRADFELDVLAQR